MGPVIVLVLALLPILSGPQICEPCSILLIDSQGEALRVFLSMVPAVSHLFSPMCAIPFSTANILPIFFLVICVVDLR